MIRVQDANLEPKNAGPSCDPVGNPINPGVGNKFEVITDYIDGAESVDLNFHRIFNSLSLYVAHDLGWGWIHSYSSRLALSPAGQTASVSRYDGKVFVFRLQNDIWRPDADIPDRLVELKDGSGLRTGWQYVVGSDDAVETYSASGRLLSIADRAGRMQVLTYDLPASAGGDDDPDTLDAVVDAAGRSLHFTYDAHKRIATVADPSGGVIAYGYDSVGNLVSVQYPDGRSKTYHYNEPAHTAGANLPHALTGITDENGDRYATYAYDAAGRAVSTAHAGGADSYTLSYGPASTTVTDPLGAQRVYGFTTVLGVVKSTGQSQPGGSGCGPASSSVAYDVNGNVARRTDFNGHTACYAWNLTRNLETARVEGLASGVACPANLATYTPAPNSAERKILTQWHASFRLPTQITEAGRETTMVYDNRGNVTSRTVKDTATGQTRTWTTAYTYHPSVPGVVVQKIEDGPRTDVGDLTTTDYYPIDETCVGGHLGCRGQIRQITNALGHLTAYDEYDPHGRLLKTTDPNGLVTTLTYSPRGWLTSRSVGGETTGFDYDGVGQLVKLTRPDASFVQFEYDPAHRLTAIVQQDGSRLAYTLDPAGNRIHEAITAPGGGAALYSRSRTFDALGRLWQDIGAYNQTVTYEYDAQGNLRQTDGARTDVADLTAHGYDPLDRLVQTLNADGGVEQYRPNALDQTTQVVDPAGQSTVHTHNAFGDVVQTQSADTGVTARSFDEAGNTKTETDARNVTVTYTWDALNRLTKKESSQSGSPVYTYQYDTCLNGKGRLCSTQRDGSLDTYFNYDVQGRLAYRFNFGSSTSTIGHTWRPGGQPQTVVYPGSRTVIYGYDAQGRISQVSTAVGSHPAVVLAGSFVHGAFGGPLGFQYGNGQTVQTSLDADYRPTHRHDGPYDVHYGRDPAGNIGQLTEGAFQTTYGYDATGRLVSALDTATGSFGSLAWSYDQNGNRQSETRNAGTMPYVYSPPNWLHQKGAETRSRSASGNTLSLSGVTFAYDGFDRLVTSTTASETTTYSYNALGERIRKQNQNGLSRIFHYGPDGELLYERDQQGNTKEYVWLDGRPIARIDNGTAIYYYHVDHLGTPQAMTNQAGTTVWRADYEPFGKANVTTSTVENNLRFPGQYFDRETGLHYNYFRDYDPTTGRYIEADPIGLDGGMNLYAYVEGNPLIYVDPLGLKGGLFGKLLEELIPESIETTVGKGRGAKCATNLCKKKPSNLRIIEECAIQAKPSDSGFSGGILNECIETCKELLKKCDPDNCEDK
ncbi:RHS repeat protein [Betaproteobacteria bacterium SCN1]|nr:RHS repeat protein [Betaproteobacteria bacterium SCN1]